MFWVAGLIQPLEWSGFHVRLAPVSKWLAVVQSPVTEGPVTNQSEIKEQGVNMTVHKINKINK